MELDSKILLGVIALLFSIIVYFTKKIFDNTDSISKDVSEIKPKVEILWLDFSTTSHSPRQLNQKGLDILNTSGVKEIIEEKQDELLRLVRQRNISNPYDAERTITDIVSKLPEYCPDVVDKLKKGAFESGVDIGTALFVGSIHLRNRIFPTLGFSLDDLDKPNEKGN